MLQPTSPTGPAALSPARVEHAKVATSTAFVLAGFAFATWAGRIPTVRQILDLTPGQLGLLLLAGAAGSLLGLPMAGKVASRFGNGRAVLFGSVLVMIGLILVGVMVSVFGSTPGTAAFLFVTCLGIGLWDVSMNIEGAEVERRLGRTIMPRFHAAFSLGTVVAAGISAAMAAFRVPVLVHFAIMAVLLFLTVLYSHRFFLPSELHGADAYADPADPADQAQTSKGRSAWTEPRTLLIGLVTMVAAFTEGTANDWLSVAFVDGYHLPDWAGILGLAVFLTFMTIGRVFGTHLLDRFGRVPVVRVTLLIAGVGSLMMVFGTTATAFIGAAVWGFGVSLGFPVGMSAAADDPKRAAARVSVVATISYLAFLAGPPALGWLGDHVGVLRSLSVVSVLLIFALLATPVLREPQGEKTKG